MGVLSIVLVKQDVSRLAGLAAVLAMLVTCSAEPPAQKEIYKQDVEKLCALVPQKYAYYDKVEAIWSDVCQSADQEMENAATPAEFLGVLERMIDDLADAHVQLNRNSASSPRLVPTGADVWFASTEAGISLVGIRPGSAAAKQNLKLGDKLVSYNDQPADEIVSTRIHHRGPDISDQRFGWALNAAIAGNRGAPRVLTVQRDDQQITVSLGEPAPDTLAAPLTGKVLEPNIGYIRFNNSLGNIETVGAFNTALEALRRTDGLILDLRDTPGGGGTDIAEPILGRLISEPAPYQLTVPIGEAPIPRIVKPTGTWTYESPVIVLAGRWTGSMGEGMTIGLDGLGRAQIMGDVMAGLAGGTECFGLDDTGLSICMPTYDLHHVDGTPRHMWHPDNPTPADFGQGEDTLLQQAVAALSANVE